MPVEKVSFSMGQHHVLKLGLAILVFAIRSTYALQNEPKNKTEDPEHYPVFYQGVEGTPGIDFPIYSHIPKTSFSCKGIESGYYADLDTDCQVFHICEEEKKISFLCPNGTIFQQSELICEWWFKVNCTDAPELYAESAEHLRNDIARRKLERRVKRPFGAVMRTEEVSTVSAKRNGKDIDVKKIKTRRYNDDQTGNFINRVSPNGHSKPGVTIKEYHIQFGSTSSGFDKYETNGPTTLPVYELEASTRKYYTQQNSNLNKVKTVESTTQSEYELQFPTHRSHNQKISSFNQIKNVEPTSPSEYELEFPTHKSYSNKDSNLDEIKTTESLTTPEYELEFPTQKYSSKKAESDELIREESASFVKSPLNSIQDNSKKNNNNPYPNHRTTYSDIKTTPKFNSIRTSTTISSVTPQYITTQPINNGKPFLGSRVGTNLFTSIGTVPVQSTSTTTSRYTYLPDEESKKTAKVLINQAWGSTTPKPVTTTLPVEILFTSPSSKLPLDRATVYGSQVSTTPVPRKKNKPQNDQVRIGASSNQGVPIKFDKNTDKIELTLSTRALSNKLEVPLQKNSEKIPIANIKSKHSVNGKLEEKTTILPTFSSFNGSSYLPTTEQTATTTSGFFVTKPAPRPFKTVSPNAIVTATYTNYKISSASPFKATNTLNPIPTQPTPFTNTVTSPYENIDNMINVLKKIMDKPEFSQTPRPGLVVPPSVGPQTLHTLAVYFANALDGSKGDKQEENDEEREIKREKLMNILTQMTLNRYNNLFDQNKENDAVTTTETPEDENNNNLETQSSHNLAQSPEIRELARNFSIALSSYLDDPEMFKKDLEELRPTEPPASEENQYQEDELLNFSDADITSSLPPVFSTVSSNPGPTWGFILAPKFSEDVLKNHINPDLNTADSQSFVPGFNNLNYKDQKDQKRKVPDTITTTELPENHWTSSFNATSLWNSAFSVNPVSVNDHFETTPVFEAETETDITSTEEYVQLSPPVAPEAEVDYELRTLPKLTLNSTQIRGILIDFMNKTSPDAEKLHRILKRLNTTEGEFLTKMKEIEMNPLTKRLILLLISECGINAAKDIQAESSEESLTVSETAHPKSNSYIPELINPELKEDDQDARALQLLNTLYQIASRFG